MKTTDALTLDLPKARVTLPKGTLVATGPNKLQGSVTVVTSMTREDLLATFGDFITDSIGKDSFSGQVHVPFSYQDPESGLHLELDTGFAVTGSIVSAEDFLISDEAEDDLSDDFDFDEDDVVVTLEIPFESNNPDLLSKVAESGKAAQLLRLFSD